MSHLSLTHTPTGLSNPPINIRHVQATSTHTISAYPTTPPLLRTHARRETTTNKQTNLNFHIFQAESRADELSKTQISFKRALIRDIRDFSKDVTKFRADFVRDGPMVQVWIWRYIHARCVYGRGETFRQCLRSVLGSNISRWCS